MDSKKAGANKSNKQGPGLVLLKVVVHLLGKVEDDVMHDWNNAPTQQHVQSFTWMRQK
jgi:hypothetical protein